MKGRRDSEGMALVTALGLLALFVVLGMAWVEYMAIEQREARLDVASARARVLARAGLKAAKGDLELAVDNGTVAQLLQEERRYSLPLYRPSEQGLVEDVNYRGEATVIIEDECAKINVNFAPTAVLMEALNVSGSKARQIRKGLPAPGKKDGQGRWFASLDELVTRGFLNEQQYAAINKDILTVDSVPDMQRPVGFINVNTAPPQVLEVVLGISPEKAQEVVAKRAESPFTSLADLSEAAGKDATAFNVKLDSDDPNALPDELAFESRCYRVVSQGALIRTAEAAASGTAGAGEEATATKSVEAVITIGEPPTL